MTGAKRLSPEDQARVDRFLASGVNQTERQPFRVWRLFALLWGVLGVLSLLSYGLAQWHGVI